MTRLAGGLTAAGTLTALLLGAATGHPAPVLAGLRVAATAGLALMVFADRLTWGGPD